MRSGVPGVKFSDHARSTKCGYVKVVSLANIAAGPDPHGKVDFFNNPRDKPSINPDGLDRKHLIFLVRSDKIRPKKKKIENQLKCDQLSI